MMYSEPTAPKNPRRYGEQDGERHGPAFIEGSQAEEGEDQGHEQDFRRRTGRRAFFAALAGPFDGHPRRHDALGRFFGRCHGFTGTVAAGGAAWMVTLRTPLKRVIDDGPVVMELVSSVSRGTIFPDDDLTEMNFRLSA